MNAIAEDIAPEVVNRLSRAQKEHLLALLREKDRRRRLRKIDTYYSDAGPLRRELYPKHMRFFALGGQHEPGIGCPEQCDGSPHRERCVIAGNRTGKTEGCGGYETALHLTGRYPDWWPGRRFDSAGDWWAAGDTRQTTRDIQQAKLLGPINEIGTGLIPGETIVRTKPMSGVPDAIESVWVRHVSGGLARLGFKSYDQGRKSFQGTEKDGIWLDEEPPEPVFEECVVRTMETGTFGGGMILLTFTPLEGLTPLVLSFFPGGEVPE